MLEGATNIGRGHGTFDRNLDMGAFRDQEEGGMEALPSQNGAQLNISTLQDCYYCRGMWVTKHSMTLMHATVHKV